jgi:hypothetical protein
MASIRSSEIRASVVISIWVCGRKIGNNIIHFTLLIGCRKRVSSGFVMHLEDKRKLNYLVTEQYCF